MQVCDDAYQWRSILSLVSCDADVPNKERIPLPEPRPPEARGGPEREPDRGQLSAVECGVHEPPARTHADDPPPQQV